ESLAGATALPTPREALNASLRGWSALLAPRFVVAMQHLTDATLLTPDYRALVGEVPANAPTGPTDPLALALLRAATAQLELAQVIVERAQVARDVSALGLAAETLRFSFIVESLAHDLFDRARDAGGSIDPVWGARYRAGEGAFVTARERL